MPDVRLPRLPAVSRFVCCTVCTVSTVRQFPSTTLLFHCSHAYITEGTKQLKKTEEIMTVIRDQGVSNTQLLGVMAKQQNEAQRTATAAMTAQNEAHKNFQDTIASIVVPLSQRPPTAVHLPKKDPKRPDWDGDRTHLLLCLHQVDQNRETKEIPDTGISKKCRQTGQRLSNYSRIVSCRPISKTD